MYQANVEAMPRELKDALLGKGDFETHEDIMSCEDKPSLSKTVEEIKDALSCVESELPHYWLVTFNTDDPNYDLVYFVFESKLTEHEEGAFLEAVPCELDESLSDDYSIY